MFLRITLLALSLAATASAQTNTYDLQSGGHSLGRASFTLARTKQGFKLSSHLSYHINGVESDISNEFKLSDAYAYLEGASSSISSQMHTSYVPNKTRTDLVIGMVQGGVQDSRHLAIKPDLAIMPPFDPGAAQVMLLLATTHPTGKNLYNVVVPGSTGGGGRGESSPPPDPSEGGGGHQPAGNNAFDALFTKGPDGNGTLDGKPMAIHTYILTAGKNTWTFFADDQNNLMQLDNSMVRASYIRAKFKLDQP
jgi:hypothetical protein